MHKRILAVREVSSVLYGEDDSQNEKEMIKAQLCVDLMAKYRYPAGAIWLRHFVQIGSKENARYVELDINVLNEERQPALIVEVAPVGEYEKSLEHSIQRLFELGEALDEGKGSLSYLLYYTRWHEEGRTQEKFVVVDYQKFKTFEFWNRAGRPSESTIPKNI